MPEVLEIGIRIVEGGNVIKKVRRGKDRKVGG